MMAWVFQIQHVHLRPLVPSLWYAQTLLTRKSQLKATPINIKSQPASKIQRIISSNSKEGTNELEASVTHSLQESSNSQSELYSVDKTPNTILKVNGLIPHPKFKSCNLEMDNNFFRREATLQEYASTKYESISSIGSISHIRNRKFYHTTFLMPSYIQKNFRKRESNGNKEGVKNNKNA